MASRLREYLADPFLAQMYEEVRAVGPIRSISVDLADACNLRCEGCYFFAEAMDRSVAPVEERDFDDFIAREKARGTNFVTVVGGEPTLEMGRLRKIYENFWMSVATNGTIRIPYDGLEQMPIGIAVWGDHGTDRRLRGGGLEDVFATALENYRDDPRAFWYYTLTPGNAHEIPAVVRQCVENGNRVLFNFYGDLTGIGGDLDHRHGFDEVHGEVQRAIQQYPDRILLSDYVSEVVSTGTLYGERWGHEVCTSLSVDHPDNRERLANDKPFNRHFLAYNADLRTTRRCCTGVDRACGSCFDVWGHFSWIMLNLRRHLGTQREFTAWLTTMYLFYVINRIVDFDKGIELLPEIHRRTLTAERVATAVG